MKKIANLYGVVFMWVVSSIYLFVEATVHADFFMKYGVHDFMFFVIPLLLTVSYGVLTIVFTVYLLRHRGAAPTGVIGVVSGLLLTAGSLYILGQSIYAV